MQYISCYLLKPSTPFTRFHTSERDSLFATAEHMVDKSKAGRRMCHLLARWVRNTFSATGSEALFATLFVFRVSNLDQPSRPISQRRGPWSTTLMLTFGSAYPFINALWSIGHVMSVGLRQSCPIFSSQFRAGLVCQRLLQLGPSPASQKPLIHPPLQRKFWDVPVAMVFM